MEKENAIIELKKNLNIAKLLIKTEKEKRKRKAIEEARQLTDEEIQTIINALPIIYSPNQEASDISRKSIQSILITMLKLPENKLVPSAIEEFKQIIINKFERSKMFAGQPVGILASQAISAQLMQATLNTFKSAGSSKNVSLGFQAYSEILTAKKDLLFPSCDIYFKDYVTFTDVIINKRPELVETTIGDIMSNVEMKTTSDIFREEELFGINHYRMYQLFNNNILKLYNISIDQFVITNTSFIRIILDINKMYKKNISVQEVCDILLKDNETDIICIPSPIIMVSETNRKLVFENNVYQYKDITQKIPVYYIDVYTYIGNIKKKLREEFQSSSELISDETVLSFYHTTTLMPSLNNIYIKGIIGIKNIYPEKQSVWSIVNEEIRLGDNRWLLVLDESKIRKTGITNREIEKLCRTIGIEVIEKTVFALNVKTPNIPEDASTKLKKNNPAWNPGQVVNYHKLKDLDEFNQYAQIKREEKNKLISEGRTIEANLISTVRPLTNFENALDFIYAVSDGSNLYDLMRTKNIDSNRTISNNMHEIIQIYGAEAARSYITEELYSIVNQNENYIDPRHTMLIADHMTFHGFITPISEVGLREHPVGTLTMAGYKVPKKSFHSAAITGSRESLLPVYQSIMTGRMLRLGTGLPTVTLNKEYEQKLYEELKTDQLYELDAESLADTYKRLEKMENDELVSLDEIEQPIFMRQDEIGNIVIKEPTYELPKPNLPMKSGPSSILSLAPLPVVSDATIEIPNRVREMPVIQRDLIEDIKLTSLPPKQKSIIGSDQPELSTTQVNVSFPQFTTNIETPQFLTNLNAFIQSIHQ